jgi:hypothetical protein
MLAYIPYMDPMGNVLCVLKNEGTRHSHSPRVHPGFDLQMIHHDSHHVPMKSL